jgi:hypothetical protein
LMEFWWHLATAALSTSVSRKAAHDAVALLDVLDGAANGDNSSSTLGSNRVG